MNNYIEELEIGDCFVLKDAPYILTCDSKSSGSRLCIKLSTGEPRWFNGDSMVQKMAIFYTDQEGSIIAVKETKKDVLA